MLNPDEKPYRRPLEDHLTLSTAASEEDVERVAAFNSSIHDPDVGTLIRSLFLHHPATSGRDLFFVADEESGEVVSSLCFIPWMWAYGPVEIPAGELGMVGTAEAYRHRGLVRTQVDAFKRRLRQRGCLLSHIQGIPYFYRQFGYEHAPPLEAGLRLELRRVPRSPEPPFTLRLATPEDIPALQRLYDEAARDLTIHTKRGERT
jgi:predicted N-acetyltransferase YhbS